jgi:hypothetical protein
MHTETTMLNMFRRIPLILIGALALLPLRAVGQDAAAQLSQERIEQLVAPIALHPDELVSQILMASTYPLEVVQAARWVEENPDLSPEEFENAIDEMTWDPSVKSLTNFPDVLAMMNSKLDWLTDLGDAFLDQQEDVLAAVQRLRSRARQEGNLESNEQQNIIVESTTQTIVIESKTPEVIYVPSYNPTVVYGTWPYPAYPPYYYPPRYPVGVAVVSFSAGVAVGAAWSYSWGRCNWNRGRVDININRNTNLNIKRTRDIRSTRDYRRTADRRAQRGGDTSWRHNPTHRRGASYRDGRTAERYGRGPSSNASRSREQFRGRADSGRRDLGNSIGDRNRTGSRASQGGADRTRRDTRGSRGSQGSRGSAFDRSRSGSTPRAASDRGRSSRSGASRGSGGSRSGASRGSGSGRSSGSRGGGGRRGGGRR